MSAFSNLYDQISQLDRKLIGKWKKAVVRRIKQYARNVAKASPFLDKPAKRIFGMKARKENDSVVMFGTSPNAGRMKGFNAPVNEWIAVNRYFRVLRNGEWYTIHKVQKASRSAGVPLLDVPYFGTSEKPDRFFGIKKGKVTLAYGRTKGGLGLPVYARESFVDWLFENHADELENLVLESGRDVLADYLYKGVAR